MAIPSVIELVLKKEEFKKEDLQNFCLICKAWVLPTRSLMFANRKCLVFSFASDQAELCAPVTDLKVQSKQRADTLIELLTARQALISVIKAMTFTFQPSDPSVPKAVALRESLPSPLQFILLLTLCAEAKQLVFENVRSTFTTSCIRTDMRHLSDGKLWRNASRSSSHRGPYRKVHDRSEGLRLARREYELHKAKSTYF